MSDSRDVSDAQRAVGDAQRAHADTARGRDDEARGVADVARKRLDVRLSSAMRLMLLGYLIFVALTVFALVQVDQQNATLCDNQAFIVEVIEATFEDPERPPNRPLTKVQRAVLQEAKQREVGLRERGCEEHHLDTVEP